MRPDPVPATVVFRTSAYGRVGHVVIALACGALTVLMGAVFSLVPIHDIWSWIFFLAFTIVGALLTIYCIGFAFERGHRIICTREGLQYRGLLRTASIRWTDIAMLWFDFNGDAPFVHLNIRTENTRWWRYHLNVSGMTPTYVTLFALAREMAPQATVWLPRNYALFEQVDTRIALALRETLVDDTLGLVRVDPKKPVAPEHNIGPRNNTA